MDFKYQLSGLNQILSTIYGAETSVSSLLANLGFEQAQIALLWDQSLEPVVLQLIEALHKHLTSESGKDTWFQLLSRHYGLDGESSESLDAVAGRFGFSPEYARQVCEAALQKCRYKTTQDELRKKLRYIAIGQLAKITGPPPREHITEKLERLTNLRAAADLTRMDFEAKRLEILKQVQAELDALDAEYSLLFESAEENLTALESEIKNDVLMHGESVQAGSYRAAYVQGRVSWDNDGMNQYAETHPDILQFRKQGQPTVMIRSVEEKKK